MSAAISPALLEQAADWVITLHFSEPSDKDKQDFERWRSTSPEHQAAWARAEVMRGSFERVSNGIGRQAFQGLDQRGRRGAVRALGAVLLAIPAGWLAWQQLPWPQWSADIATAKGERRTLALDDGTQIILNGNSAIDLAFSASERRIMLRAGEILVTTHADPVRPARPFLVHTKHGTARALGTRFSARLHDDRTRIAVFEHAIEITTTGRIKHLLHSSQQASFDEQAILDTGAADPNARLWASGMLVARNMRLADVVAELDRQRSGFLRCDAAIADLRVSGALPLDDVDASLRTLAQSLPIQINQPHHYWTVVAPRKKIPK